MKVKIKSIIDTVHEKVEKTQRVIFFVDTCSTSNMCVDTCRLCSKSFVVREIVHATRTYKESDITRLKFTINIRGLS